MAETAVLCPVCDTSLINKGFRLEHHLRNHAAQRFGLDHEPCMCGTAFPCRADAHPGYLQPEREGA